tara:strand:- start:70 stop:303 length:234 start_codon:yes stop_codon:yes gene_type:complete
MITNYAKNIYKVIEQAKFEDEKNKTKNSGLLSPVRNFNKNKSDNFVSQPAYRVAKYFNTLRKKRMEFKNGTEGNETE